MFLRVQITSLEADRVERQEREAHLQRILERQSLALLAPADRDVFSRLVG